MIKLIRYGKPTAAPALVAVPGMDGSIGSIHPVVEKLSGRGEVLLVDYTGEVNPTLEELTAEIAKTIKTEAKGEIDLYGQSIGTILAAQLASLHGLPVRKVALTCTFTRLSWTMLRAGNFIMSLTPAWLYRLTVPWLMKIACGPVGDGNRHLFFRAVRQSNKRAMMKRTGWEINRDFSADLARIHNPLLILMGEKDRSVSNAAREIEKLRRLFAGHPARIVTIPDAGHVFLPSAAVAFAAKQIEEFLNSP